MEFFRYLKTTVSTNARDAQRANPKGFGIESNNKACFKY
jgi:hypothetical protein